MQLLVFIQGYWVFSVCLFNKSFFFELTFVCKLILLHILLLHNYFYKRNLIKKDEKKTLKMNYMCFAQLNKFHCLSINVV